VNELVSIISAVPALQERLETWQQTAERAYPPNTPRAWRTDWRFFTSWCESHDLPRLPAAPETIAPYLLAESAAGGAVATIRRRAATIAHARRAAEIPNPCDTEKVRMALRTTARERGTNQHQAPALCAPAGRSDRRPHHGGGTLPRGRTCGAWPWCWQAGTF
jgi:hypothetical protein